MELDDARLVVSRRHADLHDPDAAQLVDDETNPTVSDYGYLARANDLCFWARETVQAEAIVLCTDAAVPACVP